MNNAIVKQDNSLDPDIIASLVINGDSSKLTQQQKVAYYNMYCERVGLDPVSQPFKMLRLNGKEIMYCDRSGAQQLNKNHKVSHEIKAREKFDGIWVVTAQASTPDGRRTESIGAVPIEGLKGEQLANAIMKAETKAKRRATLDLLGLGIPDESEVTNIQRTEDVPHTVVPPPVDPAEIEGAVKGIHLCTTAEELAQETGQLPSDIAAIPAIGEAIAAKQRELVDKAIGQLPNETEPVEYAKKQADFIKKAPAFRKAVKDCETALAEAIKQPAQ